MSEQVWARLWRERPNLEMAVRADRRQVAAIRRRVRMHGLELLERVAQVSHAARRVRAACGHWITDGIMPPSTSVPSLGTVISQRRSPRFIGSIAPSGRLHARKVSAMWVVRTTQVRSCGAIRSSAGLARPGLHDEREQRRDLAQRDEREHAVGLGLSHNEALFQARLRAISTGIGGNP
jgi:hypothetical protein